MKQEWWLEIMKAAAASLELIDALKDNLGSRLHKSYTDAFIHVIHDATQGIRRGATPGQQVTSAVIQAEVERALDALQTVMRTEREEDAAAALEALSTFAKDAETIPGCQRAAEHLEDILNNAS